MNDRMIRVGISHGDINGIAYELLLKTFEDVRMYELCIPVLYGSTKVLAYHRKAMELPSVNISTINKAHDAGENRLNIINFENEEVSVEISRATPEAEQSAGKALGRALDDLKKGAIDVLVTAPSGLDETAFFRKEGIAEEELLSLLVDDSFRIALTTGEIPLSDVATHLDAATVTNRIKQLQRCLIRDFAITLPRIAVLSFNPASGIKEQKYGKEETDILLPAIKSANDAGVICFGPYSADDFFGSGDYLRFDATLAIYYDQGHIPFRTISQNKGVHYTVGLQQVITSPDQQVSYEKAGKNISDESSFRNALYTAIDIFRNRQTDRVIRANPLKKHYFERGSDNEKLDLTKEEE